MRSRLVGQRTAVINQIRGFLLEHGIAVRQGLRFLRQQLPAWRGCARIFIGNEKPEGRRFRTTRVGLDQTAWMIRGMAEPDVREIPA